MKIKLKYQFNVKSLNKEILNLYIQFLKTMFENINLNYCLFNIPNKKKRLTILKSPHVNKSAKEQFEIKYYKTIIQISQPLTINLLKLLISNKPKTISIKIKKI